MGYFPSYSSSSKPELLEETDFFSRLETAKDDSELKTLLSEGKAHFSNLGRFGLADKVTLAESNQGLSIRPKL